MNDSETKTGLGRQLAKRLRPLTLGIALLISLGFPAIYSVLQSSAESRTATIYARWLAQDFQLLILESPDRWKYESHRITELLATIPTESEVTVIRLLDDAGRPISEQNYAPERAHSWGHRYARVGSAPLIFNNRQVGTIEVELSAASLIRVTFGFLLLCTIVGVSLAALAYVHPVRVVTDMEGRIDELVQTVQRSSEETRRLNAQLEQRVSERTAQLAERERELRNAKGFLEHIIAANPVIILQGDPRDPLRASYVSPNVERVLGYTPEEVLSTPHFWIERTHPEDRPALVDKLQRAVKERAPQVELEYRFLHKSGEYRWLRGTRSYTYDAEGNVVESLGFPTDVTEAKAAEEAVRTAKDEAERASRAKSEFLSRMSHELRTPLNAILGFAQLMEMDSHTLEQREGVAQILKGGRHLLDLINELLDITRIEAGRLAVSPEPVALAEVVRESLDLIAPSAAERGVQMTGAAAEAGGWHVQADRQRLKQVLLNLLSNAVKFNRKGGTVVLSCDATPEERVRIKVSDTGPGIPPDKLQRLFTPFERLGIERAGIDGMGIGLALSKGLVDLMGGEIGVESEVDRGSTFWVELARAESPIRRYERTNQGSPARTGDVGHRCTVLYIEDSLSDLELIQRLLAHRPEIKLIGAMQGRLGLDLAQRHAPDLILLDLHLPDVPGDEILRRLREVPEMRGTRVVVISADTSPGQAERLRAAGAHDYLTKPLDVQRLVALLDDTLKETTRTNGSGDSMTAPTGDR